MFRLPIVRALSMLALLATVSACALVEPEPSGQFTLYVAPALVDCEGVGPQQCLQVKERPDDTWSNFYGSIEGFEYEPGYTYTLLVEWRHVPDPPADGSSREYRLIRILARASAPGS